jgi:hypothetical protein
MLTAPVLRHALQEASDGTDSRLAVDVQLVSVLQAAGIAVLDEQTRAWPRAIVARADSAAALVLRVCAMQHLAELELRPGPSYLRSRAARRSRRPREAR